MSTHTPFYTQLARHSGIALIGGTEQLSYLELEIRVQAAAEQLKQACISTDGRAALLGLVFSSHISTVIMYLAALRSQVPVVLVDPELSTEVKKNRYMQLGVSVEFSLAENNIDLTKNNLRQLDCNDHLPHTVALFNADQPNINVALMLSTSGSSGTPKAVMLSTENICNNTDAIVQYLALQAADVAITTLPLHYSYGLSVLNTHLKVGAAIVLTEQPLMTREFWQLMRDHCVTSLSGVPFHYQMLQTLRLERMDLPALRYLTQAGGKLSTKAVTHFSQLAAQKGWELFVMYGQTEATARMAFMPPALINQYPNAIGHAIPGGRFEIRDLETGSQIKALEQSGELWYFGRNVMLGYAQTPSDWQRPPAPTQSLATGDLACWTEQGLIEITGRLSRFIKVRGKRLQLDHLEQLLAAQGIDIHCCGEDDQLFFVLVTQAEIENQAANAEKSAALVKQLAGDELHLHPSLWSLVSIAELPYLANGKINYAALLTLCLQQE